MENSLLRPAYFRGNIKGPSDWGPINQYKVADTSQNSIYLHLKTDFAL